MHYPIKISLIKNGIDVDDESKLKSNPMHSFFMKGTRHVFANGMITLCRGDNYYLSTATSDTVLYHDFSADWITIRKYMNLLDSLNYDFYFELPCLNIKPRDIYYTVQGPYVTFSSNRQRFE